MCVCVCVSREGIGYSGDDATSCKDAYTKGSRKNGPHWIVNSRFSTGDLFWCDQTQAGGGWMLVAKIVGGDSNWHYGGTSPVRMKLRHKNVAFTPIYSAVFMA